MAWFDLVQDLLLFKASSFSRFHCSQKRSAKRLAREGLTAMLNAGLPVLGYRLARCDGNEDLKKRGCVRVPSTLVLRQQMLPTIRKSQVPFA